MSVSISGAGSISGLDQGFNVTSGSVGIGTDVPQGELHVKRTSSTGRIIVEGAALAQIGLRDNAGGTDSKVIQIRNSAQNLLFGTQTDSYQSFSEKVRITSDGKVAIGFNAPAVAGLSIANSSTSLGFEFDTASGFASGPTIRGYHRPSTAYKSLGITGADIKFGINDVEKLRLDSNGYLGLNNAAPHNQYYNNLVIGDGSASGDKGITIRTQSSNEGVIAFSDADSGAARYAGKIAYNHGTNAMMFFTTNGDERLRITSAGGVTIGSGNNDSSMSEFGSNTGGLTIDDAGVSNTGIRLSHGNDDTYLVQSSNSNFYISQYGAGDMIFGVGSSGNERLRISSDGKVCVGTTLTNYGVLQIRDASGDSTTSAIQVENASSGNSTTNVILRSVSLNSGAWANAQYRAKSHDFCFQTTPAVTVLGNFGPWAEGNKGTTRGTIHLRPAATDHMGGAITFGASDRDSGETAMAGIYTRTDGNYGTKMYFATTDSYATGPKNAMAIDQYGYVTNNKNPSFLAYNFTTRGMGTNLVAASTYHNTGNNYSTSTGIFTAPVAGHYMFSFALLHSNSPTTYARVLFRYNGNYTTQYADTLISEPGDYVPTSATMVFYMNVNDTMQLFNEGNNVYGYQYGSFSGHFLG